MIRWFYCDDPLVWKRLHLDWNIHHDLLAFWSASRYMGVGRVKRIWWSSTSPWLCSWCLCWQWQTCDVCFLSLSLSPPCSILKLKALKLPIVVIGVQLIQWGSLGCSQHVCSLCPWSPWACVHSRYYVSFSFLLWLAHHLPRASLRPFLPADMEDGMVQSGCLMFMCLIQVRTMTTHQLVCFPLASLQSHCIKWISHRRTCFCFTEFTFTIFSCLQYHLNGGCCLYQGHHRHPVVAIVLPWWRSACSFSVAEVQSCVSLCLFEQACRMFWVQYSIGLEDFL